MNEASLSFIKNKSLLDFEKDTPHALATYRIDAVLYKEDIIESIAVGQSLGAWNTTLMDEAILRRHVAKVVSYEKHDSFFEVTLAFPEILWHGHLSWLLTLVYGKISFYPSIQLRSLSFCGVSRLTGPQNTLDDMRKLVGVFDKKPLLMGILKPNVAMSAKDICDLYVESAQAGLHILKDDEIRFDEDESILLDRVRKVAQAREKFHLKTQYVVNLPIADFQHTGALLKKLEHAGAQAFLVNSWVYGIGCLQWIRGQTALPLFSHPALVGAFGHDDQTYSVHAQVSLAQILRAAGADFTLFPSPYGKPGLPKQVALAVAKECLAMQQTKFLPLAPVLSAGILPQHVPLAKRDFGTEFVLNAGTAIFSDKVSVACAIKEFLNSLLADEI